MNCGRCHNPMTFAQPAQQWWSLRLGGKVGAGLAIVGVLSAIAGAILGQIGRAMQGRVI